MDGRTTLNLALNIPSDSKVYTLDLPYEQRLSFYEQLVKQGRVRREEQPTASLHPVGGIFQTHALARKIGQLSGNSLDFDFSPYYKQVDMIFIDGNHDYEYVKSDSIQALKMLSEDGSCGTIIWHDYPNSLGVTECLAKLSRDIPIYHLWETTLACYTRSRLVEDTL